MLRTNFSTITTQASDDFALPYLERDGEVKQVPFYKNYYVGGIGSVHGTLLGVAAIAVLNNGLVHARQPREMAGMLTGLLLILALASSALPKLLASFRSTRQNSPANKPQSNSA